jgi:ATPase subunit of ABC transporter with duplicated ATPase domains
MNMNRTLYDELLASFPVESTILREISECEMSISSTVNDMDTMSTLIDKLQQLQMSAEETGAYFLDARLKKAATSVGFEEEDFQRRIGSFSGGWKMRIGLAKILSQDPNILLLDEPTNHLDLESIVWLEKFLRNQNIPMIIVSHDREFLDQVCNKIVEVEDGKTVSYEGNYSRFLELRRLHLDQWRQKFDKQMKLVHEEELWIKSAKNNPSLSTILKSKIVALENFKKSSEWISAPPKDKKFRFRFPLGKRSAAIVVVGKNLSHGYGSGKYCTLFQNVNLNVERGRRVGFVGPNGSGKSTLLRLIMGMETPKSGYVEYGSDNVVASYYAQSQADMLDLESSVLDSVANFAPEDMSITDIRGLLGQFMFKGDDVEKKIKMLSGGEKARVALCRMLLTPANLLILDEPTNHLDICTKEVLEEALLSFAGSIFLVSHDRYFLSQIANTIFEFKNKTISRFDCDYHDYVSHLSHDNYLKDQLKARRVIGDKYAITKAKEVVLDSPVSKSRNFGGSGVTCGNLHKGIKNAKRFIS